MVMSNSEIEYQVLALTSSALELTAEVFGADLERARRARINLAAEGLLTRVARAEYQLTERGAERLASHDAAHRVVTA